MQEIGPDAHWDDQLEAYKLSEITRVDFGGDCENALIMGKQHSADNKRSVNGVTRVPKTCWQLQTAKARFSELFRRARNEGPQWITRRNTEAVVLLPAEQFENLIDRAQQPRSLARFFAESPLANSGIKLERTKDCGRKVHP